MSGRSGIESLMMASLMLGVGWLWRGHYGELGAAKTQVEQANEAQLVNAKSGEILANVAASQGALMRKLKETSHAVQTLDACRLPSGLIELLDAQTTQSRANAAAGAGIVPNAVRD